MRSHSSFLLLLLLILPLIFSPTGVEGGKRVHITDDLDDVVDDEEDEAWKEWGKNKRAPEFDPPPSDLDKMELSQIQEELMKRHMGPAMGFVKLRLGIRRDEETVGEIAMRWSRVLRTGAIGVRFTGIDMSTIMFNLEDGQRFLDLKEFILSQDEAYEMKIGDQAFRRPGDPPLDEVLQKLRQSREMENQGDDEEDDIDQHVKEEL